MSQGSDDALTGPITPGRAARAADDPLRRWNIVRSLTAAVLLVVALLLPWNLYFGVGVPDSQTRSSCSWGR